MRIYASKKQAEMIMKAVMTQYGVDDRDAMGIIKNTAKCLEFQCIYEPKKGGKKK